MERIWNFFQHYHVLHMYNIPKHPAVALSADADRTTEDRPLSEQLPNEGLQLSRNLRAGVSHEVSQMLG